MDGLTQILQFIGGDGDKLFVFLLIVLILSLSVVAIFRHLFRCITRSLKYFFVWLTSLRK